MTAGQIPSRPPALVGQQPSPVRPFIDRERELALLSSWAHDRTGAPILTIVGLGGMGKTALSWEWFRKEIELPGHFQGAVWWSFYEADSERFFVRCHAYLTGTGPTDSAMLPQRALLGQIVTQMENERLLLVLDGFEREMVAFAPLHAADVSQIDTSHRIRHAASAALAEFLKACVRLRSGSKVLLTSRAALADLEDSNGRPIQGTQVLALAGLDEASTRMLLSQLGISEDIERILQLVAGQGFHPLTTSLIARLARDRPAMIKGMGSTLDAAPRVTKFRKMIREVVDSAGPGARLVATTIAASPDPVRNSELENISVGPGKIFARHSELDRSLTQLQDLGLITWNVEDNLYSMHPVVRRILYQAEPSAGGEKWE